MRHLNPTMFNAISYDLDHLIERAKSGTLPLPNRSSLAKATVAASVAAELDAASNEQRVKQSIRPK